MINLPHTNLNVSEICLGTAAYGNRLDIRECFRQLDCFTERYNFIDTARVYGNSESVIGRWLTDRKCRARVIISTKGAHPEMGLVWTSRMTKDNICCDLDLSLKALNTDCIDLYFLHRDDRNVPVSEIIGILEDLRRSGKIRYYGCSNWTVGRISEALDYAESAGYTGFVCNQVMLSLTKANTGFFRQTDMVQADKEMIGFHKKSGMALMSYMALAGGYFIKLMDNREIPENYKMLYDSETNRKRFEKLSELCHKNGYTISELLLHYVSYQPFPSVPVAAFSSLQQMDETFSALERNTERDHIDYIMKIAEQIND